MPLPKARFWVSFWRYVLVTLKGATPGSTRSVLDRTNSPVPRSTGSPSVVSPSGPVPGGLPPKLIIAPVNAHSLVSGSGITWLPSDVTVPWPYTNQPFSSGSYW